MVLQLLFTCLLAAYSVFLYSKRDTDFFTWHELENKLQISNEISELLQLKLLNDVYIRKSEMYSIKEEDRFEITSKFKLFYSGLDEKENKK